MSEQLTCEIINKEVIIPGIYRFTINSPQIANKAVPGQFLEIRCSNGIDPLLRRPISISGVNRKKKTVDFIVQVRGNATKTLSERNVGESLDILGPLGKGFTISNNFRKIAIIGGGIGIFPLLFLGRELQNTDVYCYLGFRTKSLIILIDEFIHFSKELKVVTNDGSYGYRGLVTNVIKEDVNTIRFDMIYGCGPLPMLKSLQKIALELEIPCEISVEERMACGVGACLGCAIKLVDGDTWTYGHVCKNGPVFSVDKLIFE